MKHGRILLVLLCLLMVLATVLAACSSKDKGTAGNDGVMDGSTGNNNNNTTGGDTSSGGTTGVIPSSKGLKYRLKDNGTYEVSGYDPKQLKKHVLIPETYEGEAVTSVGEGAFENCDHLVSIIIPNSVMSIEQGVFFGCSSLESITLPFVGDSVKSTSDTYQYPFGYIFGTTSYTGGVATVQSYYGLSTDRTINDTYYIPESLKSVTVTGGNILRGAFSYCSSLTSITISSVVTSIGPYAFYRCTNLTSIEMPSSVTSIGNYAFNGCSHIQNATMPTNAVRYVPQESLKTVIINGGTVIGDRMFGYLSSLTSITISASVTSIGNYAFLGCSGLTSVTLPASVTSIGRGAFYYCSSLTSIKMPSSVTSINSSAFAGCSSLTSITIPANVTSIGSSAFYGCSSLTNITIPANVMSIGEDAFGYCIGLNSITFGDNSRMKSIGKNVFSGCSSLKSITIPASVTSIGRYAFYGCSNLTNITIPTSVTSIDPDAFGDCNRLTSVTFENTSGWYRMLDSYKTPGVTMDVTDPATNAKNLRDLYYNYYWKRSDDTPGTDSSDSDGLKYILKADGTYEVSGYDYMLSDHVVIPETYKGKAVTSIGSYVFVNCTGLTSITIPASVTSIGTYAFLCCDDLTAVYITDIGAWCNITFNDYAANPLSYAHNLYIDGVLATNITIPSGVTSIGNYTFRYCSSLTSITIPASVTSVGASAFYRCNSLASITFSGNSRLTSIGSYAFSYCSSLTSITIPASVASIGSDAFSGCSSLTKITFENISGWYRTTSSTATSGTSMSVANPTTNAKNLTDTYSAYYWNANKSLLPQNTIMNVPDIRIWYADIFAV